MGGKGAAPALGPPQLRLIPPAGHQCRSVPVSAGQCRSVPVSAGQWRSAALSSSTGPRAAGVDPRGAPSSRRFFGEISAGMVCVQI